MMSTPSITSGLSGEASTSDGQVRTGRRLAKTPSVATKFEQSLLGAHARGGADHFGPPMAPSRTADLLRHASIVRGGSAEPEESIAMPPNQRCGELEFVAEACGDGLQHTHGFGGDFGTDAVTAEDGDTSLHRVACRCSYSSIAGA